MDILDLMEREGTLMHQRELDYFLATHERASRFVLWHTAGAGALLLAGYGQPFAALVVAQGWPAWAAMVPVVMAALWFVIAAAVMWAGMKVETTYMGILPSSIDMGYQADAQALGCTAGYGFYADKASQASERRLLVQARRSGVAALDKKILAMQAVNKRRARALRYGFMASVAAPMLAFGLCWLFLGIASCP